MIKSKIKKILDDTQFVSYSTLSKLIDKYEEISFDIFDTLIKRNVPNPTDVFELIEINTGRIGYAHERILAEKKARLKKKEVKLEDIYKEFENVTEKERELLAKQEIDYELNLCTVNKEMMPIFVRACTSKRVFLISDMYLSRNVICKILNKNGIVGYEGLIISNEVNLTKSDGTLFRYVLKKYKCKKMIHIGNNLKADYIMAKLQGISSEKISTNRILLSRKYNTIINDDKINIKRRYLEVFLSNYHMDTHGYYFNFGFERFGPVLYGFISWLFNDIKKNNVEEVFFMARDGYVMQKVYKILHYDKIVPDKYFEVSRRSLRIPSYVNNVELEAVMKSTPLLSVTNIYQVMDSFGLDYSKYNELIRKFGYDKEIQLKRDELIKDKKFRAFYEIIKMDILKNAEHENVELIKYLLQFDFSKKIAIVDIGWGGSMQKNLLQILNENNISYNITGYYFGLTKKSKENLGKRGYKAKAYLFDCLNNNDAVDIEISFRPLFETLFLEQKGSVKCYKSKNNITYAVRYEYEYSYNDKMLPEANCVREIQTGAQEFVRLFHSSKSALLIGYEPSVMFEYLYQTGTNPTMKDTNMFGDFAFFNNGNQEYLSKKHFFKDYMKHPRLMFKDLLASQWKIGYLKRILKIPFPYLRLYMILHRNNNPGED